MQSERRRLEIRINFLLESVPKLQDDELRAELTQHLCVLSSGLLEVTCRDILRRYSLRRSAPSIRRFVESRLEEFKSAKVKNIHSLLREFDPASADTWRVSLSDEAADSVDSIINNRHQIAHGRSIGLSFDTFHRYHIHAVNALALIEKAFPTT